MNWHILAVMLLMLWIILLLAGVMLMYVRHWASRQSGAATAGGPMAEGEFFKRYIPDSLRDRYDHDLQNRSASSWRSRNALKRLYITLLIAGAVVFGGSALYLNIDRLMPTIDLTPDELASVKLDHHELKRVADQIMPDLNGMLGKALGRGLTIVSSRRDDTWKHHGVNPQQIARQQWEEFLATNWAPASHCYWETLDDCIPDVENRIFIVTPGYWDKEKLYRLLAAGASILLTGPPAQIYAEDRARRFNLFGLHFARTEKKDNQSLVLAGDQLLTVGLDATLALDVALMFDDYVAYSRQPQALGMSDDHVVGGDQETRLYAKTIGKGRLVWMDFSPLHDQHSADVPVKTFNGLLAAIFRYLAREPYSGYATWPEGRQFAGLIEEDTEDKFKDGGILLDFFIDNGYPVTWYMLSNEAQNYRSVTKKMAVAGEVACHGDNHVPFTRSTRRMQAERIARCRKVLHEITGQEVRSFRPPEEKFNSATLNALLNNNIRQYIAETAADRSVPSLYRTDDGKHDMVSIPRMVSDDYEMWFTQKMDERVSRTVVHNEMDWIEQLHGLYMFSFHTQYMHKESNRVIVREVAERLRKNDAYIATTTQIADWWRLRTRLIRNEAVSAEDIDRFKPIRLSVGADGMLKRTPVYHSEIKK